MNPEPYYVIPLTHCTFFFESFHETYPFPWFKICFPLTFLLVLLLSCKTHSHMSLSFPERHFSPMFMPLLLFPHESFCPRDLPWAFLPLCLHYSSHLEFRSIDILSDLVRRCGQHEGLQMNKAWLLVTENSHEAGRTDLQINMCCHVCAICTTLKLTALIFFIAPMNYYTSCFLVPWWSSSNKNVRSVSQEPLSVSSSVPIMAPGM